MNPTVTGGDRNQANVCRLAATINAARRTSFPCRVLIAASELYNDPRHAGWSMVGGKCPSDGVFSDRTTPFGSGCEQFPPGTIVNWLTPTGTFDDAAQAAGVQHFWRAFFHSYGAELRRLTPDPTTAFTFEGASQFRDELVVRSKEPAKNQTLAFITEGNEQTTGPIRRRMRPAVPRPAPPKPTPPPVAIPTAALPAGAPTETSALSNLRGALKNVVIVRDLSGSMGFGIVDGEVVDLPKRKEAVIRDISHQLQTLPCERLCVIGFTTNAEDEIVLPTFPTYWLWRKWGMATPELRSAAAEAQAAWPLQANNPMLAGLQAAMQLPDVDTILLYADGDPGGDRDELLTFVDAMKAKGVTVNAIGVGPLSGEQADEFDVEGAKLMREIATRTDGAYLRLETEE